MKIMIRKDTRKKKGNKAMGTARMRRDAPIMILFIEF